MEETIPEKDDLADLGVEMHALMGSLYPICRSITGNGVRETLSSLNSILPINQIEVASGTPVFDWTVPDEWNISDAYVMNEAGERIIDFRRSNLHVVSYSEPIERTMSLDELRPHLHTLPERPRAIPYVTSYYSKNWGFCLAHEDYESLSPGTYTVKIESSLQPGSLTYGEFYLPGAKREEILLATNICHPSMANNELSGIALCAFLGRWLSGLKDRRYSYRILFLPETIGALTYLSKNLEALKRNVIAGYQVVCVGGPDKFTLMPSRLDGTLAERAARHVLTYLGPFRIVGFQERGSDERQWCSPGANLPIASIMRSKYHDYPQYHNSDDDMTFVRPEHLAESFKVYKHCLSAIEANSRLNATVTVGEPNLGKRGLFPQLGGQSHLKTDLNALLDVLAYADGEHDLLSVAEKLGRPYWTYLNAIDQLKRAGLVEEL